VRTDPDFSGYSHILASDLGRHKHFGAYIWPSRLTEEVPAFRMDVCSRDWGTFRSVEGVWSRGENAQVVFLRLSKQRAEKRVAPNVIS